MSVVFDIYKRNGFFHKRSKIIYEGREAFIPTSQVDIFKELCVSHPEISRSIKNNGCIYINGLKHDVCLKVYWKDKSMLSLDVDRNTADVLVFFNIHCNNLFT